MNDLKLTTRLRVYLNHRGMVDLDGGREGREKGRRKEGEEGGRKEKERGQEGGR